MKKALLCLALSLLPLAPVSAYRILYKEDYFKLYHEKFYHYPDDTMELIYYLEKAQEADFANPLYAMAKINDKTEWERYRYLFNLHVDLKLIYLYLALGTKWRKQVAYFYNAPWKKENLESLQTAERIYRVAYGYWTEAQGWSAKAWELRKVHLEQIQQWEDESFRIQTGELDYKAIIDEQLAGVAKVRAQFQAMDASTY